MPNPKLPFTKKQFNKAHDDANKMCEARQAVIDIVTSKSFWGEIRKLSMAVESLLKLEKKGKK